MSMPRDDYGDQMPDDTVPRSRLNAVELELTEAKDKLAEVQKNAWGLIEEAVKKGDALKARVAYLLTVIQELLEATVHHQHMIDVSTGERIEYARTRLQEANDEARSIVMDAVKGGILSMPGRIIEE